ncbi:MAG TPA: ATP-dependent zinc metalloprotease FtsH [Myxococcota bacterium]|nr:ATP-dependent zinc metalloprotease FtsH [Myxococcota bacterium]
MSVLGVVLLVLLSFGLLDVGMVPYSKFKDLVSSGQVSSVTFEGEQVTASMAGPDGQPKSVRTVAVPNDPSLVNMLQEKQITYGAVQSNGCGSATVFTSLLMFSLVAWFIMMRPGNGAPPGVATFGKSQAKLAPEEGTGVTFKDVAGIDEAEEELNEIVQFLKQPDRFTRLGGKIPKGVLLVGPPGTGKTLLARAVAGEAGVPFYSISGSDFVEMFVGVGAARVRDLFKNAAERAPCIIFIDELDAIGKARGASSPVGGHDEREQTLNQLLVEMDGFDGRKGIIIMAATNRPETLDPALLRAGRFDRQVVVDRPDVRGREAILQVHARGLKLGPDVDLKVVAQRTPGFSGADLANAMNEAALLAARRDAEGIAMGDIEAAVERMVVGLEKKSRRLSDQERRVVAYHEAGHAICGAVCPGSDTVSKISIIPRGVGALGYTLHTPNEDRYLISRQELKDRMVVLYGGRVAEELIFSDFTSGASDDISKASDIARRMVGQYGMSDVLGAINYGADRPNPFGVGEAGRDVAISPETARAIDGEVRRLVDEAYGRARQIVTENRDLLVEMADKLLVQEVLDGDALKSYLVRAAGKKGQSGIRVPTSDVTSEEPLPEDQTS